MAAPFVYDQTFTFDVDADELWAAVTAHDRYQQWWPWLVGFDLDAMTPGARAACEIQAPLPYRLRFGVDLVDVDPGRAIHGQVVGDLAGPASFHVTPDGPGCVAGLRWSLTVQRPLLGGLARIARPAMVWGHDRIIELGLRQFVTRALAPTPDPM